MMLFILLCLLGNSYGQAVPKSSRVDCHPSPGATKELCIARQCIWDENVDKNDVTVPLCYFPRNTGYIASEGEDVTLTKAPGSPPNPYGKDISPLSFRRSSLGGTLHVEIRASGRYGTGVTFPMGVSSTEEPLVLEKSVSSGIFSFAVIRQSTKQRIWDTSIGGLLFADKYIQIATYLPSDKLYGFGENVHQSLKHDFSKYTTWGMFARDEAPDSFGNVTKNLYGVHPFYLALEHDFKAHGVLILNPNAQEVTTGPAPHLVYRTTGGIINLFFFPGPEPEQVIQQYLALIGTPFLPAYFALGFQLCRFGFKNLDDLKSTIQRVRNSNIPIDVAYADIDYMDHYKDFTIGSPWREFGSYAEQLHNDGMHLILIFDPAIQVDYDSFKRALEMNASFIEWERFDQVPHDVQDMYPMAKDTKIMLGVVWPEKHVAFPDFLDFSKTTEWWINEFKIYHDQIPFDGAWIDMNEPSNFDTNKNAFIPSPKWNASSLKSLDCPLSGKDSEYDSPPYATANVFYYNYGSLSTKTLCMMGMTNGGKQRFFDTKNLYGLTESIATQKAIRKATGKRGVVISRSTFPSSGHYTGHWLGDNTARWEDLRTSIIGVQEFNLFGIPYVGSDICGFMQTTTEELCLRWQQMGAFHSFSRNHNDDVSPPQDPAQWPSVAAAASQANFFRYHYLPYLFSLHFEASLNGGTVVRPVFFEFPSDVTTHTLSYQFMWGSGMLIAPVTEKGARSLRAYLPPEATWYSIRDSEYGTRVQPGFSVFNAPLTDLIPVFARGGVIIPRQAGNLTTTASRQNPFELLIPLAFSKSGEALDANGRFYWDDGESIVEDFATYNYYRWDIRFVVTDSKASLFIQAAKKAQDLPIPTLDIIDVIGYHYFPDLSSAKLNGKAASIDVRECVYDAKVQRLLIRTRKLIDLAANDKITLTWSHSHPQSNKSIEF